MTVWVVILFQWAALLMLLVLLLGAFRLISNLAEKLEGIISPAISTLHVGDGIPNVTLGSGDGSISTTSLLSSGSDFVVIALSQGCGGCKNLIEDLAATVISTGHTPFRQSVVLVSVGEGMPAGDDVESLLRAGATLVRDTESSMLKEFGIRFVPTGFAFDGDGRLKSQSQNPHDGWLFDELGYREDQIVRRPGPRATLVTDQLSHD